MCECRFGGREQSLEAKAAAEARSVADTVKSEAGAAVEKGKEVVKKVTG